MFVETQVMILNALLVKSRFNFIKRSLGIEQKVNEIIKNDSNEQSGIGNNINSINVPNENNNPNNKEDNDRCIIL